MKDSLDRVSNMLPGVLGKVLLQSLPAKALASKACLVTGAAWTDLVWMETTLKALQLQH